MCSLTEVVLVQYLRNRLIVVGSLIGHRTRHWLGLDIAVVGIADRRNAAVDRIRIAVGRTVDRLGTRRQLRSSGRILAGRTVVVRIPVVDIVDRCCWDRRVVVRAATPRLVVGCNWNRWCILV